MIRRTLLAAFVTVPLHAQPNPPVKTVTIPLDGGRLSALAVARNVLDAYGYDGSAVRFPDVWLSTEGLAGRAIVMAFDHAVGESIDVTWGEGRASLELHIDPVAMRVLRRDAKQRFAKWLGGLVGQDLLARHYELELPAAAADDAPYVICVHGVDSSPTCFDDLRAFLAAADPAIATGTFRYSNDEAIDRVARELATRLRAVRRDEPDRRVALIAHSMGGLVCRYVVEHPELDPGNVETLVMLGTPNHGSRLARLRTATDIGQLLRDIAERPKLLSKLCDGLGEAGWDMWPESPFLAELNARERNPAVTYHSVLGDRGSMDVSRRDALRDRIAAHAHRLYRDRVVEWIEDLDEVIDGAGDGAVSVERGRLDGVDEVVVPLSHRALTRAGAEQHVFERVHGWLAPD